jgi:N-acetylmuramoyl-L-alanine amidase
MALMHRRRILALAIVIACAVAPVAAGASRAADPVPPPLSGIVIALDPGHNGGNASHGAAARRLVFVGNGRKACNTTGTTTRSGYPEHRFAFAVAERVKAKLEALGATVFMTRNSDKGVGPCVNVRGRFGAKVHARLLVSIHADGSGPTHRGFVVMKPGRVPGYTDDIITSSGTLAKAMRAGLLATGLPIANYYATNGIKKRTDLGTLNMSDVPAVMVELGNMKNATDAKRMTAKRGRASYATGLVAGIRAYLGR